MIGSYKPIFGLFYPKLSKILNGRLLCFFFAYAEQLRSGHVETLCYPLDICVRIGKMIVHEFYHFIGKARLLLVGRVRKKLGVIGEQQVQSRAFERFGLTVIRVDGISVQRIHFV